MRKISIIIPVYNTEKYIKACLESIISQMNNDIELIIIDDSSTDNSLKIIKETIKNISNTILIENIVNKGISYSRNIGLSQATGEYIFFIDSDDYLNKEAINIISKNLDSDILNFSYNRKLKYYNRPKILELKNNYSLNQNKELIYDLDCFVWNKVFRKELINNLRFKESMKYEDLPFSLISLMNAKTMKNIPDVLYNYRINYQSVTFQDRYIPNDSMLDLFLANDVLDEEVLKQNLLGYEEILKNLHIYHSFGSVMNSAFWFKMSNEDRLLVVNLLIDSIKKKYKTEDIYSSNLVFKRSESSKLYNIRLKYIRKMLDNNLSNSMSFDEELHNVKKIIRKYQR